jgi:hypothetical protein
MDSPAAEWRWQIHTSGLGSFFASGWWNGDLSPVELIAGDPDYFSFADNPAVGSFTHYKGVYRD